jgi:hypothetical protein
MQSGLPKTRNIPQAAGTGADASVRAAQRIDMPFGEKFNLRTIWSTTSSYGTWAQFVA